MRIDKLTPVADLADKRKARLILVMRIWTCFMVVSAIVCAVYFPLWTIIFLAPFGVITYVFSVIIAMASLNFDSESYGVTDKTSEFLPSISAVSTKVIGSLNGKSIYEWVALLDSRTKKHVYFTYYGPTPEEGPPTDGQLYLDVGGVLYVKSENTPAEPA